MAPIPQNLSPGTQMMEPKSQFMPVHDFQLSLMSNNTPGTDLFKTNPIMPPQTQFIFPSNAGGSPDKQGLMGFTGATPLSMGMNSGFTPSRKPIGTFMMLPNF